ncbi:hypothetical protein CIW68_17170 [Enterobacter cloacae]|nr:hypothetical protein BWP06_19395 [Enterobacter cloacae]PAN67070.1 hypothetical protein CIW70_22020 [Enterobacter cloacae]PAN69826.1 hypothetical protein CIW68_17170 [Enterobacter cloacae]PAN95107.1 hypothetical protein CIW62_21185 [Enterobacter cloacae]PAO19430.1 hypothetical protein CIW57_04315 [Enterobacter cloacae]
MPYKQANLRSKPDVIALNLSSLPIVQIEINIAVLFFYGNKFPTIQPTVCQQQWGSHGHGQTQ